MHPLLLRTLPWLPGDSATSPTAAALLAAASDTTPSCRMRRSVTETMLRAHELQHATKPLWRSTLRRHAPSVAQDVVMAVRRLSHVADSCSIAGSSIRHDAKLPDDTLSHADNAESEGAAARNKALVAANVEATCILRCSGRSHGCLLNGPRHQQLQDCSQHGQTRCRAVACHAQSRRQC